MLPNRHSRPFGPAAAGPAGSDWSPANISKSLNDLKARAVGRAATPSWRIWLISHQISSRQNERCAISGGEPQRASPGSAHALTPADRQRLRQREDTERPRAASFAVKRTHTVSWACCLYDALKLRTNTSRINGGGGDFSVRNRGFCNPRQSHGENFFRSLCLRRGHREEARELRASVRGLSRTMVSEGSLTLAREANASSRNRGLPRRFRTSSLYPLALLLLPSAVLPLTRLPATPWR